MKSLCLIIVDLIIVKISKDTAILHAFDNRRLLVSQTKKIGPVFFFFFFFFFFFNWFFFFFFFFFFSF